MALEHGHGWRETWLNPLGAMVVLLMLTLGTITYVALEGQRQRQLIIELESVGQVRDEALHQKTSDLLRCLVTSPGDLRNPNLDPVVRENTEAFLDRCFENASAQADREVPPLRETP